MIVLVSFGGFDLPLILPFEREKDENRQPAFWYLQGQQLVLAMVLTPNVVVVTTEIYSWLTFRISSKKFAMFSRVI